VAVSSIFAGVTKNVGDCVGTDNTSHAYGHAQQWLASTIDVRSTEGSTRRHRAAVNPSTGTPP
jgi:hypothetical protein